MVLLLMVVVVVCVRAGVVVLAVQGHRCVVLHSRLVVRGWEVEVAPHIVAAEAPPQDRLQHDVHQRQVGKRRPLRVVHHRARRAAAAEGVLPHPLRAAVLVERGDLLHDGSGLGAQGLEGGPLHHRIDADEAVADEQGPCPLRQLVRGQSAGVEQL